MNRDKQIEEMVNELGDVWIVDWDGNPHNLSEKLWQDDLENIAIELHNIGYRKADEVAREIFEEADKIFMDNCISLESYAAWLNFKKKYTEEP